MTLGTLILGVGIVAAILTGIMYALRDQKWIDFRNAPMSFLQNFVGVLFLVSGFVKAVDPLGTAYKMEQYFAEFKSAFSGTWFSFLVDLFPILSDMSIGFSVFMIVFEIVLGVMVLIGHSKRFTAWAFMLLIVFFTFLTGFTYLTGYVPSENIIALANDAGENITILEGKAEEKVAEGWTTTDTIQPKFFKFSTWGDYVETNMKVTDCGCFGDFLKLAPKVSFLKDVFLLIPAFLFLIFMGRMHQVFLPRTRTIVTVAATILTWALCYYSYAINLPFVDFRPFKNGVDVKAQKKAELDAAADVEVTGFKIKNTKTNEVAVIGVKSYSTDIKSYPEAEGWDMSTLEQIKTEPAIPKSKISEYAIQGEKTITYTYVNMIDPDGDTLTDFDASSLSDFDTTGYQIIGKRTETQVETVDIEDDLLSDNNYSFMIVCHHLEGANETAFRNKINALHAGAEGDGYNFYVVSGSSDDFVEQFRHDVQAPYPFYSADDILLKTIVRSNPGVVLWKNGAIVQKWHHRQLPSYEKIKAKYIK